jgi:hypothetical protein
MRNFPIAARNAAPSSSIAALPSARPAKTNAIDQEIRAEHQASLNTLDPQNDPNLPPIIRFLDSPGRM